MCKKKNNKKLIINIKTESDNDVESERTRTRYRNWKFVYGECQCESGPLTKENKGKENNDDIQFIRKVPTYPKDCLKQKAVKNCEISLSIINNVFMCQQKTLSIY